MFVHKKLEFPHKAVLTSSMLEELYDYPRKFSQLMFDSYSDGIICGLDYLIKDRDLILSAGIFRMDGELYFLPADLNISDLAEKNSLVADCKYFIALKKTSVASEQCVTTNILELTFTTEQTPRTLGNFIFLGKKDFNLPDFVNDIDEIFENSVFNLFDVPFAAKNNPTFHPQLFRQVRKFLREKINKTPLDFAILLCLLNGETISVETMTEYIATEGDSCDISDRKKFFQTFLHCLKKSRFVIAQPAENSFQQNAPVSKRKPIGKLL